MQNQPHTDVCTWWKHLSAGFLSLFLKLVGSKQLHKVVATKIDLSPSRGWLSTLLEVPRSTRILLLALKNIISGVSMLF